MSDTSTEGAVRARLGRWPDAPDVAHLVLLDHHMVPSSADVVGWVREAGDAGARAIRTGALFSPSRTAFVDAGFRPIDTLILLSATVPASGTRIGGRARTPSRTRRLRPSRLDEAAELDRRCFPPPWGNDAAALTDILTATPHHRARAVHVGGRLVAFAISGRAERTGYIQRLAVDPSARRRGHARALVVDALAWMHRRGAGRALVNTAVDNTAAIALYRSLGFDEETERLQILERTVP
jgi:ribosomal protein S18 acetylase RimI-like enzyme